MSTSLHPICWMMCCVSLFGCVAGTDSTDHTPVGQGIEGESVDIHLRTAPAGNFKDVSIVLFFEGQPMGAFPMHHVGVVNGGDEYDYPLNLPRASAAKTMGYSFVFTNSGRTGGTRSGGMIRIVAKRADLNPR